MSRHPGDEELHARIVEMLKAHPDATHTDIARQLGTNHGMVRRIAIMRGLFRPAVPHKRHEDIVAALYDPENQGMNLRRLATKIGSHSSSILQVANMVYWPIENYRVGRPPSFKLPPDYKPPVEMYERYREAFESRLPASPSVPLTERKQEIKLLSDEGKTSKQIADILGVTPETVRKYAKSIGIIFPRDEMASVRGGNRRGMEQTVFTIDAVGADLRAMGISLDEVSNEDAELWAALIGDAIREIRKLHSVLKEHASGKAQS
jgi:DNA-binding CsgD family transcriptional regulator